MSKSERTTVGVLGGGQLGRMLALAGYPLGLRFRFLDPSPTAGAGEVGELVVGEYSDPDTLARFAADLDIVTYEFENVPVEAAHILLQTCHVYPPATALATAQGRLVEKSFFQSLHIPTTPFLPVDREADLDRAQQEVGLPAVLKTRRYGYDGKGQVIVQQADELIPAWSRLDRAPLIWEGFVPYDRELSLLAVRSTTGELAFYPLVENTHRNGMLRQTLAPAPTLAPRLQNEAETYARRILNSLSYVGVLALEFFQVGETLLINEMAPRVHNSGHWTIEGAETSQFENHLRALLGLPLGAPTPRGVAAMVNLIGTLPPRGALLDIPAAHLHLYGKAPRPGRKLGHVTLRADNWDELHPRLEHLNALVAAGETNAAHSESGASAG